MKGRIFSGIQPSGNLHLGNYLGAIRNWVRLQGDYEAIYCIVDLHAITVPQEPAALRAKTHEVAAGFLAAGIDAEHNTIFVQSHVPAHTQLAWVFNCVTPLGLAQPDDPVQGQGRQAQGAGARRPLRLPGADGGRHPGLPGTHVPVGEDQKQHIELARDIAGAFNRKYDTDFFPLPEPLIFGEATRVM